MTRGLLDSRSEEARWSHTIDEGLVGRIAEVQRARILTAMVDVTYERGVDQVSIAHIVERSGISRRTFYQVFGDREECFLFAFEQALSSARKRVLAAVDPESPWTERVRSGLVALLLFLDEQPRLGRLLIVESAVGGGSVREQRAEMLEQVARSLERSAAEHPAGGLAGEGIVGAVLSILSNRMTAPQRQPLTGLTGELMSIIVLPFLGPAAARRELQRAIPYEPVESRERETLLVDPFKDAGMRLTYRTVRVLTAIAEHPGGSNRQIGEIAEIADQGQISKLLARMQRAGTVLNSGGGASQGAPNEWTLTQTGRTLLQSIHAHTDAAEPPTTLK